MTNKKIVHRVPDDIRVKSIETLKVNETVLEYLRQNGYKTIEDFIDRQFEVPEDYRGDIYMFLIYGIDSSKMKS